MITRNDVKEEVEKVVENAVGQILEVMVKGFDSVEGRLDKVEGRLDKVESELTDVKAGLKKVEAEVKKVEAEVKKVEAEVKKVEAEVKKVEAEVKENTRRINDINADSVTPQEHRKHDVRIKKLEEAVFPS